MSSLPPAEVLAARLEHELVMARLLADTSPRGARTHLDRALSLLTKLREAMR